MNFGNPHVSPYRRIGKGWIDFVRKSGNDMVLILHEDRNIGTASRHELLKDETEILNTLSLYSIHSIYLRVSGKR